MSRVNTAAIALAAVVFGTVGCGGSKTATTSTHGSVSGGRSSTGGALTREEIIARGDTICANTNQRLKATVLTTVNDYITKLPNIAATERMEATQLAQLVPPPSMQRDWSRIVSSLQAGSADINQMVGFIESRNTKRSAMAWSRFTKTHEEVAKTASHYGFKYCSQ